MTRSTRNTRNTRNTRTVARKTFTSKELDRLNRRAAQYKWNGHEDDSVVFVMFDGSGNAVDLSHPISPDVVDSLDYFNLSDFISVQ